MKKYLHAAVAALIFVGLAACDQSANLDGAGPGAKASTKAYDPLNDAIPRAICTGPNDRLEPGIQGRTRAVEDVASGLSDQGYQCNLELVGHEGTQALWQMAWFEDCAYYGIGIGTGGVGVVDATDTANPVRTATLMTPAMLDPWESLKVNTPRKLLAAVGPSLEGPVAFDLYDLSEGCAQPKAVGAGSFPINTVGHEGEWAPDGMTYYSSALFSPAVTPIDVSNPITPHALGVIRDDVHGISLSDDGNRLYAAETSPNGLEIWDVSPFQSRAPTAATNVEPIVVGSVYWDDGATAQMTIPITIKGKHYVIFIDEGGGGTPQQPGMARIIDISDEAAPVVVSKLKNEIDMPEYTAEREADGGASGFTYQGHYCGVPKRDDPELLACSYFWQGVRVFDIRNPLKPREIAYFVPGDVGAGAAGAKGNASSAIRFRLDKNEIWFTDQGHGFMVAKFTKPIADLMGPASGIDASTPAAGDPANIDRGKFGGAFGLGLLLPLLISALRRQQRLEKFMRKNLLMVAIPLFVGMQLGACSLQGESSLPVTPTSSAVLPANFDPLNDPVPKAVCGTGSQPETDIQGRVPIEDRVSGRSQEGYRCNMELKSQLQGVGASWQFAWFEDCGYYGTTFPGAHGVQVLDVSDSSNPKLSTTLTTPSMLDPWESLKVNEKRGLLGADTGWNIGGPAFFDVYDIKQDCAHPKLLASVPAQAPVGHEGDWAPDGLTYYVGFQPSMIDVSDPTLPKYIPSTDNKGSGHGLSVSADGNRMYAVGASCGNGLKILDTSQVQARVLNPQIPVLGEVCWTDGSTAQHTIPVFYSGKPYIIFVDEMGHGASRIIDISDETKPVVVSKLKLEIQMPAAADAATADCANSGAFFCYEAHYCSVDQAINPTALACGYFESGLRVFDIRDPLKPTEIAYYNPPAQVGRKLQLTGSEHLNGALVGTSTDDTTDWCSSQPRFVKERGELWATCQDNGFMVLKFTNGSWPIVDKAATPSGTTAGLEIDRGKFGGVFGMWSALGMLLVAALRRIRRRELGLQEKPRSI